MPHSVEPVAALVVAAGSGSRLGGEIPKALREVRGVPLVVRSVAQLAAGGCTDAVVVVADGLVEEFTRVLADAPLPVRIVVGGAERQHSVAHGLAALDAAPPVAARHVLVHDAARALVPAEVVASVIEALRAGAVAVVPVVPVVDSLREVTATGSVVADRARFRAVQTPQGFDREVLVAAHALVADHGIAVTDDAAACEYAGHDVTLVPGSRDALKVTEPLDLVIAEAIAAREAR